jgi:hypothetical protein
MDRALEPVRSDRLPPSFLRAEQHDAWRRVMAALDVMNGALLVEPVGSGKTWVALAVAASQARTAVAIVPAILQDQWRDAATRAGVRLHLWTHERVSRGNAPPHDPQLVIIDEAHRFRDPGTRRVHVVAPWLLGRRTLLLTATPIVNRLADLLTLLRLALPDDALASDGVLSLGHLESAKRPPHALRRVAVRTMASRVPAGARNMIALAPDEMENRRGADAVSAIARLDLSARDVIRRLLSSVLLDAAASSNAAFRQALRRYRALLLQARDAGGMSRAMLRTFAGESLDQLVLWPLLVAGEPTGDLPLADIDRVEDLLANPGSRDSWTDALIQCCRDSRPTVCFTRHRATARLLREALGEATAWVTGSDAGVGAHRVPRNAVLAAFGPRRNDWRVRRELPAILIATDVAAEGLDLQAAGRIVHVDLPWTAMRIEQREGRLLRIGQQHEAVEIVVRLPAASIERALAPQARVQRKRCLADEWLATLASGPIGTPSRSEVPVCCCITDAEEDGCLVAIRVRRGTRVGAVCVAREASSDWRTDEALVAKFRRRAASGRASLIDEPAIAAESRAATQAVLAMTRGAEPAVPRAITSRIHRLARTAALRRDGRGLARLDRLLRFVTAPPTLGARLLIARLADVDDEHLARFVVPEIAPPSVPTAAVAAVVLFRSASSSLR